MNCRSALLSLSCHSLLNAKEIALGSRVLPFAPRCPACHRGPCGLPVWSVPQRLSPNASYTVDPKAHPDLHVCKSGFSLVSDLCSLSVYLVFTLCSSSLLIRGHSFKNRCVFEPFTEDSRTGESEKAVGDGKLGGLPIIGQEV